MASVVLKAAFIPLARTAQLHIRTEGITKLEAFFVSIAAKGVLGTKLLALVSLFNAVLILVLGQYVLFQNYRSRTNQTFAVLALVLGLWAFMEFMWRQATTPAVALFWLKAVILVWPASSAVFLHFALTITRNPVLKKKWIYAVMYLPLVVIAAIGVPTDQLTAGTRLVWWGYTDILPDNKSFFLLVSTWVLGVGAVAFGVLGRYSSRTGDTTKKIQLRLIIAGFVTSAVVGAITYVVLPLMGQTVPGLLTAFLAVGVVFTAFAIVKYELFKIDTSVVANEVLSTMSESLIMVDEHGYIREANRSTLELLGMEESEVLGKRAGDIFVDRDDMQTLIIGSIHEGRSLRNHYTEWKCKEGVNVPVLFSTSLIKDRRGHKLGIIGLASDISGLREAESNRAIAEVLQEAWLTVPDKIEGLDFNYVYRAAEVTQGKVGGDFLDIFEVAENRIAIVVGDVSGKGLDAAAMASLVKNGVKAYCQSELSPAAIVARTNHLVKRTFTHGKFVTLFVGFLDKLSGELVYCNAGHPPPMLRMAAADVASLRRTGPLVGAFYDSKYEEARVLLSTGRLVIYTDGVTEARGKQGFLGEPRLRDLLAESNIRYEADLTGAVFERVNEFSEGELKDDTLILSLGLCRPRSEAA